jgi:hypothetical protein
MKGLDSVLTQLDERFSFNEPSSKYEDPHGILARALNFLTHGSDPNDPTLKALRLGSTGDWFTIIPDAVHFPGMRR